MEGYLIRLPSPKTKGQSRFNGNARLHPCVLYYVLGEGYLRGYLSPLDHEQDVEPIDSIRLTSNHVEVDAIFSYNTFEVRTSSKDQQTMPSSSDSMTTASSNDENEDDDDDDEDEDIHLPSRVRGTASKTIDTLAPVTSSAFFFALDKPTIELWSRKIHHWNRHVFDSFESDDDDNEEEDDGEDDTPIGMKETRQHVWSIAKQQLVITYRERHPDGRLDFVDDESSTTASAASDISKPSSVSASSSPWWMVGASNRRRVSAFSLSRRNLVS